MAERHAESPTVAASALPSMLRALRLPAMAANYAELATKATKARLTHEAYLYEVVRSEQIQRDEHRIARLLHRSDLPLEKTFRTLKLDRFPPMIRQQVERLRTGAFLSDAVNIVAVGKPGVGKSHLLAALGHELVLAGHSVYWTSTASLVQKLLAAKRDLRLPGFIEQLDRFELLILDDIGYVQYDRDEMEVFFTLLASRYERLSLAISTNLMFSDWTRIFKNPMTTLAAIDRVVHHSIILDLMMMDSHRAMEAEAQQRKEATASEPPLSDDPETR